jgi:hypothetical protein
MDPGLTDAEQGQVIDAVKAAVDRHLGPAGRDVAAAPGSTAAGTAGAAAR